VGLNVGRRRMGTDDEIIGEHFSHSSVFWQIFDR
jgi:hypothetical protein